MDDKTFAELMAAVREGGAILRAEAEPGRVFTVPGTRASGPAPDADAVGDAPDVGALRARYGLSQGKFAALLGISVGTLRNWEQRRRTPEGPARVLLRVAARHPEAVLDVARRGA